MINHQEVMCSIRKTTYSNRRFDIIDFNKWLISYLFLIGLLYNKQSILYGKYVILYATDSILTSKYQKHFFFEKSAFELGLLFLQGRGLFSNSSFFVSFRQTLIPESVYRPWDHFHLFIERSENHCNLQIKSWLFGFSRIFDFSVYLNYL